MRNHSTIAPSFWTGITGRAMRGDPELQVVAMYLLTSPHATMIGVFTCPVLYIAHETGLPNASVERALVRLEELGFCLVDRDRDLIWVREMARFQIGEALSTGDKRVKNVATLFAKIPAGPLKDGFYDRYRVDFHLPPQGPRKGPPPRQDAPSKGHPDPDKPLRSQEQEQEQDSSVLTDGPADPEPAEPTGLRSVLDGLPLRLVPAEPASPQPSTPPDPPPLRLVTPMPEPPERPDPADPSVAKRDLYARAEEVAGAGFGGQVTKLLKRKGGNVALARAAVETASTAHKPREYLARIIRGDDTGLPAGQLYDRSI